MAVEFTSQQKQAVKSRGGRLLVSAAAGSGKTAVLVQRVIELLCEGEKPAGVDELLVVTFTNAAASEMRAKIASALLDRLAAEPGNARLRRQLALLPGARIQTVHAFCMDLVRRNFALCGVSPDFSLADETEYSLLKDAAMDDTLENAYAQGSEEFEALQRAFCEERGDERLAGVVLEIYEKLRSHPDPDGWLDSQMQQPLCSSPDQTAWGQYLLQLARQAACFAARGIEQTLELLRGDAVLLEKYSPVLTQLLEYADGLLQALDTGWDSAVAACRSFSNPRLPSLRTGDELLRERVRTAKAAFAARIQEIGKKYLCAESGDIAREMQRAQPLIRGLCALVRDFSQRYDEEKASRNLLDFSDLEHLALRLLTDGQGGRTELAKEISGSLRELLVDEYQDTNEIQDRIFDALAPERGGVFQVGDVKQSIYRFRLANPDIFVEKYRAGADFDTPGAFSRRLALNRNFRSRPEVLSLCNFVFSRIMSRRFGDVDYDDTERLYAGAQYEGRCQSELCILDMQGASDDEDSPERPMAEAKYVASRIAQLLETQTVSQKDGTVRPARPGDFAVLLSSFQSKAPYYRQALGRLGIAAAAGGDAFFDAMEIQIMLSLLRIADNRRQDIPLISVMRSPLFFFSPDELAEIRQYDRQGAYSDALEAAAAAGYEPARQFTEFLDDLCSRAVDMTVSELLRYVYGKTGALGVFAALDGGQGRVRNLSRLVNMAMGFEGKSARGVHAFLRFVERKAESGAQAPGAPESSDAVQLMSIHKSKGLEYPVVFVCDLSKAFNADDVKKPVLFHEKMGIGIRLRDESSRAEYATQMYRAVSARITGEQRAEELRKLYVAMTRAREKLILTMTLSDAQKKLGEWAQYAEEGPLDPQALAGQASAAMWVCAPLLTHPAAQCLRSLAGRPVPVAEDAEKQDLRVQVLHYTDIPDAERRNVQTAQEQQQEDFSDLLKCMDEVYAYEQVSRLPSKLTPTGVRKLVPGAGEIEQTKAAPRVRFYHAESSQEGFDARARGSATHRFLSLADYDVCRQAGGVGLELERLTANKKLRADEAALVDCAAAERFFTGALAGRVRDAWRVVREYEFGALFSPGELGLPGGEDERILMNGAIDLLLFEKQGLCVVDFKTDRVQPGTEAQRAEQHRLQLDIYARAAHKIFGLSVQEKIVYYLATGCAVSL